MTDQRRLVSNAEYSPLMIHFVCTGESYLNPDSSEGGTRLRFRVFPNLEQLAESQVFCKLWLQGYTLADEGGPSGLPASNVYRG